MAYAQNGSDHVALSIDLESGDACVMPAVTLAEIGLRERSDLQRWISEHPEVVGRDLLLVTSEFDQWEIRAQRVPDRLDVLFVDRQGSPVVAELKRDRASDTTDMQALKYAAYCSQLTIADLVDAYSRFHGVTTDEGENVIVAHAPRLAEGDIGTVRIRIVAGSFGPSVTSVVLWLREHGIDIGCVEVTARLNGAKSAVLSARQIIPLPAAEDYLVRRRRKEQDEEERRTTERRIETSAALLVRTGAVQPGDVLHLKVNAFRTVERPMVQALIDAEPDAGVAEWTGDPQKPLRWRRDGNAYSPTRIVVAILQELGIEAKNIPGPDYWIVPSGLSMYQESKVVEEQDAA